jgi:hypothetical protein
MVAIQRKKSLFILSMPRMIVSMVVGFFIVGVLIIMAAVVIVTIMPPGFLNSSP